MTVMGPENSKQFLRKLDEKKLLDLCADILAIEGHTDIKITDGTGDGQRDIRSITASGENYLTQSKYHEDISQAVSAPEIGEVISGMLRFGYRKGLFITTARITPQAKRDLLESFPGFKVDFLEGWEIAKKVFSNLILKAIWYDGSSLDRVSYTLVVPVVARDLETDKPLPILPRSADKLQGTILSVGRTQAHSVFQRSTVSTLVFGEYRSPRIRTVSEFGSPQINLTEVILSGEIHIEDVDGILGKVGDEVASHIHHTYPTKQHFAVVVGYPCLTPLGGESSGARIQLDTYDPTTLVCHGSSVESEHEWVLPTQEGGWYLPTHPTVSQAEWIRWLNPKYDICVDITVTSPPSDSTKWMIDEQAKFMAKWWNESLFALLPADLQMLWGNTKLPQPSHWYRWNSEKSLAVWLHPYFDLPIKPMEIEPDDEPLEPFPFGPDVEKVRDEFKNLLKNVEDLGGVAVEPLKARHMVALVDRDPFPTTEITEYQGRHLVFETKTVPSPIDPSSRGFHFTVCWLIKPTLTDGSFSEVELVELAERLSQQESYPFNVTTEVDDQTLSKEIYLLVHFDYSLDAGFESTRSLLQRVEPVLESNVRRLEAELESRYVIERATERYWDKEILMSYKRG